MGVGETRNDRGGERCDCKVSRSKSIDNGRRAGKASARMRLDGWDLRWRYGDKGYSLEAAF